MHRVGQKRRGIKAHRLMGVLDIVQDDIAAAVNDLCVINRFDPAAAAGDGAVRRRHLQVRDAA